MQKIAASIRSGANAYLRRQYKGVGIFFVIMGVVLLGLAFAGLVNIFVPVAFVVGGIFSGLSGFSSLASAPASPAWPESLKSTD